MKKMMRVSGIIALLIMAVISLAACSGASTQTPASSQNTSVATTSSQNTAAATTSAATTSNPATGGSVSGLLGQAASIVSVKYDMVTTGTDNTMMTSTVWVKKNKMRTESNMGGQNVVTLIDVDAKTMYLYTPAQNSAMKMDFGQAPQSATEDSISQYNPVIIGSETLDGKPCQILQYTSSNVTTKQWIWDGKGLPVRIQATSSSGTSTMDYKNYDFSDIPDSMFVLPEGVQITSFGLPGGLPTDLPSDFPTNLPSGFPTNLPSGFPTGLPTEPPTN
jgi:outer membrane lipoprotein-sorting protein